jgi:PAS domain S-box-containing protein
MSYTRQIRNSHPEQALCDVELHFTIDDSIVITFASNQINQICGYSADDFLSGSIQFQELIHPDDTELSLALFSQEVHDNLININFRIRKKNGRIQCLKGTYKKHQKKDCSGIILKLLLQDAASLKQTVEESMVLANFSAMMEVTDDYIYFKDRNHVFTGASQTLVTLTDPSEHWTDLIGLTDYDVFPEEYADKYYSLEKQIFSGEVSIAHEIQPTLDNKGKNGWVDNRKYPIKNNNGTIIDLFGIARDITEREEMLENINPSFDFKNNNSIKNI